MTAHTTAIVVSGDAINVKPTGESGAARVEFPDSGVSIVLSASSARYLAAGLADVTRPKVAAVPTFIPDEDDEVGQYVDEEGFDRTPGQWPIAGAL